MIEPFVLFDDGLLDILCLARRMGSIVYISMGHIITTYQDN
jgi:hypothetical protein